VRPSKCAPTGQRLPKRSAHERAAIGCATFLRA
jgi:hypothetical protein